MILKNRIEDYVNRLKQRKKRQRTTSIALALASLVVMENVSWQLRGTGVAFGELSSASLAGDIAAENELLRADAPDPQTDDWETALSDRLVSGAYSLNAALIAESQLGYTESTDSYYSSEIGTDLTGCTRYGKWYGNPSGKWNTMFTCWCLNNADVTEDMVPYGSGCWAWSVALQESELLTEAEGFEPRRGDVVFTDTDGDEKPDRSGIITAVRADTLTVIEGNLEGAVGEQSYSRDDSSILSYLDIAQFDTADTSEIPVQVFSAVSQSGILVEASATEKVFPNGTVMKAVDIDDEDALAAASENVAEGMEVLDAVAVDISFYDENGDELEPDGTEGVQVNIILPQERQLCGDEFSLMHFMDTGLVEIVPDAEVSETGAAFTAESFSAYAVITYSNGNRTLKINGSSVTNTPDNPYILHLNEEIQVTYEGSDCSNCNFTAVNNDFSGNTIHRITRTIYDSVSGNTRKAGFKGSTLSQSSDSPLYIVLKKGSDEVAKIYLKIVDESPIMIKSSRGYKEINHIRAWLGKYDGNIYGLSFPYGFGLTNVDGYVPNTKDRPYLLTTGETTDFYIESNDPDAKFTLTYEDKDGKSISPIASYTQSTELVNGKYRTTVTLNVNDENKLGYIKVTHPEKSKPFWIRVFNKGDQSMNHADMEIADGGTYTISSSSIEDGVAYVDVTVYQADVIYVNDAYIYKPNGTVAQYYTSEPDPKYKIYYKKQASDGTYLDEPDTSSPLGDYEQFGTLGSEQYELASAWIQNLLKGSSKSFDATESETAQFDVNLALTKRHVYRYKLVNGNMVLESHEEIPDGTVAPEEKDNIVFKLNHQDVIDARNKCPLNNGLDFTARADFTALELPVTKELLNGTITDDQFTFDVIDLNDKPLDTSDADENGIMIADTASCDSNGDAVMERMRFSEEGDYYFEIKERIPADKGKIRYDDESRYMKVEVKKIDGILVARMVMLKEITSGSGSFDKDNYEEDPTQIGVTFTNAVQFKIPETGGCGTVPFVATGVLLMTIPFVMYTTRRRKNKSDIND